MKMIVYIIPNFLLYATSALLLIIWHHFSILDEGHAEGLILNAIPIVLSPALIIFGGLQYLITKKGINLIYFFTASLTHIILAYSLTFFEIITPFLGGLITLGGVFINLKQTVFIIKKNNQ